ncbi:aminomethyl-transferring glycine dehydrogenase [Verrucomicrobia bacterium]|nr:aminomethyl-transferring glycine dehydrogenase [Verrucomicrobiota bacterium]
MLKHPDLFSERHIGPSDSDIESMLKYIGQGDLTAMTEATVPADIRLENNLKLPAPLHEHEVIHSLRQVAERNKVFRSYIGMGYHNCIVPPVIQRKLLENPGWYTQYTPYQAEIAQGRLECLFYFQTMVCDLAGMDIANASLLDEGTAAAESMALSYGAKGSDERHIIKVSADCHPQTISVLRTRALPLGINVRVEEARQLKPCSKTFAVLMQYPGTDGNILSPESLIQETHDADALAIVATDLLAMTLLKSPGEMKADIVIGSSQRFGVPMGYGGPHAAFFATRNTFKRKIPGRIVGVSRDSRGKVAYRLALQTREQHIRREKATSNICTAQALLANMSAMYAIYHGPAQLKKIATYVHQLTSTLAAGLEANGQRIVHADFFDTLRVELSSGNADSLLEKARARGINLRKIDRQTIGISLDETVTEKDVEELCNLFGSERVGSAKEGFSIPDDLIRRTPYLTHEVFHKYHSETEMLRYLRRLESRDLSLTTSMIPLGSCTMKLNATIEMLAISWPEIAGIHPFVPLEQAQGYQQIFSDLEQWLSDITGFHSVSLQPNAGAQGEYAGLLVIRQYLESRGENQRRICIIPQSAHGTNPASAVMAGLDVVGVQCDDQGNIDFEDLKAKVEQHADELAALMITYPSTHGVFEEGVRAICDLIHQHGGQVYLDGANMNAQVGVCRPGDYGADVCHLNLHKTFCIPHGGGGPGVGPIAVASHLTPFLPGHSVIPLPGEDRVGPVAAAPWGSASIVTISWVYIRAMGAQGLRKATQVAILNANYIANRLDPFFPVLYRGKNKMVAHECIIDLRQFKKVTVEDVAKRLMDYGFHAPTVSWPVAGTMMIEPTESECMAEIDRFCEAMIQIHAEIKAIEEGSIDSQDNLLKNAPHTADSVAVEHWSHPYSRMDAGFPLESQQEHKFWPRVGRIDNVYGDRNPVCSCAGMEAFMSNLSEK